MKWLRWYRRAEQAESAWSVGERFASIAWLVFLAAPAIIAFATRSLWWLAPALVLIVAGALELRIVVSSRHAPGVPREALFEVPTLSLVAEETPPQKDAIAASDALKLFFERANGHVDPSDKATLQQAISVCRRVDALPLGLELAAARLKSMSVSELLERLSHSRSLISRRTGMPSRHQSIAASLARSFDLLSNQEASICAGCDDFLHSNSRCVSFS